MDGILADAKSVYYLTPKLEKFTFVLRQTFIHEGGIHVPFIITGPGIPQGVYNNTPVIGYDIFPTIA